MPKGVSAELDGLLPSYGAWSLFGNLSRLRAKASRSEPRDHGDRALVGITPRLVKALEGVGKHGLEAVANAADLTQSVPKLRIREVLDVGFDGQ